MHRCSACDRPCFCSGDTDRRVVAIREPETCQHCIGLCDHGQPFGFDCSACATEGYEVEPDASPPPLPHRAPALGLTDADIPY